MVLVVVVFFERPHFLISKTTMKLPEVGKPFPFFSGSANKVNTTVNKATFRDTRFDINNST